MVIITKFVILLSFVSIFFGCLRVEFFSTVFFSTFSLNILVWSSSSLYINLRSIRISLFNFVNIFSILFILLLVLIIARGTDFFEFFIVSILAQRIIFHLSTSD